MHFNFITLFPNLIAPYFGDSILSRAVKNGKITLNFINPRDFSHDKYKKVDDYMIGGGPGLLMTPQPLFDAIYSLQKSQKTHIIFLSPVGKKFTQNDAKRLANYENITLLCGRYEGVDERVVEKFVSEIFSVGDFIMTGGELAALCVCDAICRNISGVLGNANSLDIESFESAILEAPSFTKPHNYEKINAISVLFNGNHSKITALKNTLALCKTRFFRPDLYQNYTAKKDKK